jgi:hypothetical protein
MNNDPDIEECIKYNDSIFLKTKSDIDETPNWWETIVYFIKNNLKSIGCFDR